MIKHATVIHTSSGYSIFMSIMEAPQRISLLDFKRKYRLHAQVLYLELKLAIIRYKSTELDLRKLKAKTKLLTGVDKPHRSQHLMNAMDMLKEDLRNIKQQIYRLESGLLQLGRDPYDSNQEKSDSECDSDYCSNSGSSSC